MTLKSDVSEIKEKLDKFIYDFTTLKTDVAVVRTNLTNHLKHHMQEKEWVRWIIPISLTVLNLVLTYRIK